MIPNIKRIYMAWRAGKGCRRIIVGEVFASATRTLFHYIGAGVEEAAKEGFTHYPEFPDLNKEYDTNVVRILSQRLNNTERTDIEEYYSFWEISPEDRPYPLRVLSLTSGSLPTDNFEFLADFYGVKGLCLVTELAGLSYNPLRNDALKEGDLLDWDLEPENEHDPKAVRVLKDGTKIGYVKTVHSRVFYNKGAERLTVRVKRIESNGHINKVFLAISYNPYRHRSKGIMK